MYTNLLMKMEGVYMILINSVYEKDQIPQWSVVVAMQGIFHILPNRLSLEILIFIYMLQKKVSCTKENRIDIMTETNLHKSNNSPW